MRMRSCAAAAAAAMAMAMGLSGCSVPLRDNLYDPANAPVAAVRVVEVDRTAAGCGTVGPFGVRGAVGAASRGRCLVLDARGTTDPQGTAVAQLGFEFAASPACGTEPPFDATAFAGTAGVIAIRNEYLRLCAPGTPIEFTVVATDPSDGIGRASAFFTPLNSPPTARINDAPRTVPLGGYPWAPGAPVALEFHGESEDADDDPVTYAWTFSGAAAGTDTVATPSIVITGLDTPGRLIARLVVSDLAESSEEVSEVVYVREPSVWEKSGSEAQVLRRIDGSARTILPFGAPGQSRAVLLRASSLIAISNPSATALQVAPWPEAAPSVSVMTLFSSYSEVAADPAGDRVWLAGVDQPSGLTRAIAFDRAGQTIVSAGIDFSSTDPVALSEEGVRLAVDDDGNAWVTGLPAFSVARFDGSGVNPVPMVFTPGGLVTAIATRPGTGEVWVLTTPDFFTGTPGPPSAALHVYSAAGAEIAVILLPWDSGFGLAWSGASSVWTHGTNRGLLRLDGATLRAGGDPESSIRAVAPEVLGAFDLVVDPLTGDCWTGDFASLSWQVRPDGTVRAFDIINSVAPQFIDDAGAFWVSRMSSLSRVFSPDAQAVDAKFTRLTQATPSIDLVGSGLWTAISFPPSIEFHGEDGSTRRSFSAVTTTTGGLSFIPPLELFRVAPDGKSAWYVHPQAQTLQYLDLRNDPPSMREVAGNGIGLEIDTRSPFLEPGAPIGGAADFAWFVRATNTSASVWTATAPNTLTMVYDLPDYLAPDPNVGQSPQFAGAVSWRTNALCVAMREQTDQTVAGTAHLFYVPFGGPGVEVGTLPIPPDDTVFPTKDLIVAGITSDASGDACWIAYTDERGVSSEEAWSLRVFDELGTPVHELLNQPGLLLSLQTINRDEFRITRNLDGISGAQHSRNRYAFDAFSNVLVRENPLLDVETELIAPGALLEE